jgi:hypothetical protein
MSNVLNVRLMSTAGMFIAGNVNEMKRVVMTCEWCVRLAPKKCMVVIILGDNILS